MAASTKSGLSGGVSGGGGPTDVQSARTLYGHDLHLRSALEAAPVNQVQQGDEQDEEQEPETTGRVERPVTLEEEIAPDDLSSGSRRIPSHSGKSRFPALARLFGRWNTQGQFESGRYQTDDLELDEIPRERFLRPLAIVVATAAISFFIVVGLLRLRDTTAAPPSAEPPVAAASPAAPVLLPPAPRPAAATATLPIPRPAAVPAPAPRTLELPPPTLAVKAAALAPTKRAVSRRRTRAIPLDPDAPMPLSF